MTSKQRAYLRGLSNDLQPVIQVGKGAVTPELTESVNEAFNTRELLKIAVLKNCTEDVMSLADTIAARTRSSVVSVVGRKIVLYKPDKKKPVIVLPN